MVEDLHHPQLPGSPSFGPPEKQVDKQIMLRTRFHFSDGRIQSTSLKVLADFSVLIIISGEPARSTTIVCTAVVMLHPDVDVAVAIAVTIPLSLESQSCGFTESF
jgi:hypothetical protein